MRELASTNLPVEDLQLPPDPARDELLKADTKAVAGRRIPEILSLSELGSPDLSQRAVLLPRANTLSGFNFHNRRFGRLLNAAGRVQLFNPEIVLVKFKGARHVAAIRVGSGQELQAARALVHRPDVQFAELDEYETRESFPDDPLITNQWHHQVLGSAQAWALNRGQSFIRIAIVDAPFQMDHPDLSPHVVDGWDADQNVAITNSSGIDHSTLCAGLAAAVVNNGVGIAGMGNCAILPININGAISEMYDAVIWAADHGVRVVNISWTGGDSDTLNAAGAYLEATDRGILIMAGGNADAAPYATNQPDVYCISMTDAADNMQSLAGPQVDFAAPGWNIYSTVTGGGYDFASGTSYSAPVFAGVAAVLMSINPTLGPDDVIGILKATAYQPDGWPSGQWNEFYGWGRIDFASAASVTEATLPMITGIVLSNGQARVTASYRAGATYSLWRSDSLEGNWFPVSDVVTATNSNSISLIDPSPPDSSAFYRITSP
ncbi:MAG TPA: S8 family serine peptidase [Candidatus Angelobacter sp.]|nr:S8 family serine peptidase [Candidatus Angelobacter sp.]